MSVNLARSLGSIVVGIAAAIVLVAVGVLVFLNPVWVGFEQSRTHADLFTGYTIDDVHGVTNAVIGELIAGPATFLQAVGGAVVFDPRERQHLADVRSVLLAFFGLVVVSGVVLVLMALRTRDRAWLWRSVGGSAAVLAGAVVVVGALFALFFDAAFDLFHRLLFAGGSYTFDPSQERLVQLFPEDFWAETSIALALVILVLAVATAWFGLRRAGGATVVRERPSVATREAVS